MVQATLRKSRKQPTNQPTNLHDNIAVHPVHQVLAGGVIPEQWRIPEGRMMRILVEQVELPTVEGRTTRIIEPTTWCREVELRTKFASVEKEAGEGSTGEWSTEE